MTSLSSSWSRGEGLGVVVMSPCWLRYSSLDHWESSRLLDLRARFTPLAISREGSSSAKMEKLNPDARLLAPQMLPCQGSRLHPFSAHCLLYGRSEPSPSVALKDCTPKQLRLCFWVTPTVSCKLPPPFFLVLLGPKSKRFCDGLPALILQGQDFMPQPVNATAYVPSCGISSSTSPAWAPCSPASSSSFFLASQRSPPDLVFPPCCGAGTSTTCLTWGMARP